MDKSLDIAQQNLDEFITAHSRGDREVEAEIIKQIADACGLSERTLVYAWRKGRRPIREKYIPHLARFFGTTETYFRYKKLPVDLTSTQSVIRDLMDALITNGIIQSKISLEQLVHLMSLVLNDAEKNQGAIDYDALYNYIRLMVPPDVASSGGTRPS